MPKFGYPLRVLDLFCGAGGCAKGYRDAGFYVVGVDSKKQKHYAGNGGDEFHQADALEFLAEHGHLFDAIHASPPCQKHSQALNTRPDLRANHRDFIPQTREGLIASGKPYVIENVVGAPIERTIMLCGSMFGLATPCGAEIRRHRLFEIPWWPLTLGMPQCDHGWTVKGSSELARTCCIYGDHAFDRRAYFDKYGLPGGRTGKAKVCGVYGHQGGFNAVSDHEIRKAKVIGIYGDHPRTATSEHEIRKARTIGIHGEAARDAASDHKARKPKTITVTGHPPQQNGSYAAGEHNITRETFSVVDARAAMGCPWMTISELAQAIPPAYTQFIGRELMLHLRGI